MADYPAYMTTRRVAELMGELTPDGQPDTRKVHRWLKKAGALEHFPGKERPVLPVDKMREIYPRLWDRYCQENAIYDEPNAPCVHEDPAPEPLSGGGLWCSTCGAIKPGYGRWKNPTGRPSE